MAKAELVPTSVEAVEQALLTGEPLPEIETDPNDAQRQILLRILAAESAEDLSAAFEAWGAEDVLDVPIVVKGVRWFNSSFAEGAPIFAALDVTVADDGKQGVVTCSSVNVMGALINLGRRNAYPALVRIRKSERPSQAGFHPLRLIVEREQVGDTAAA